MVTADDEAGEPWEEIDVFGEDPGPTEDEEVPSTPTRTPEEEAEGPDGDGTCHVCEAAPGHNVCVSCERRACSDHFWVMFALCRDCATEEEIQRLQGRRDDAYWSDVLDIKWVR